MNQPIELSLEQEFSLRSFADQVQRMSREQAQEFLLILYQQMLVRETMYRDFLKHEWRLDSDAAAVSSREANYPQAHCLILCLRFMSLSMPTDCLNLRE